MKIEDGDMVKFLAAGTHLGTVNPQNQMRTYIFKRRVDGDYCFVNNY